MSTATAVTTTTAGPTQTRFRCTAGRAGTCPRGDTAACCQECPEWGACFVCGLTCSQVWGSECEHKEAM